MDAKSDLEKQVDFLQNQNSMLINTINEASNTIISNKKYREISCANNQKDYIKLLINMERKYKIPSGLLQNVAYYESRYNPSAVSHRGAVGIMQLHPKWHKSVNAYDPYEAIPYAAKYLHYLYNRFESWEIALAAWNWGEGNISKYPFYSAPKETKNFVKNVLKGTV